MSLHASGARRGPRWLIGALVVVALGEEEGDPVGEGRGRALGRGEPPHVGAQVGLLVARALRCPAGAS